MRAASACCIALVAACGGLPPPAEDPPAAPAENDPDYEVRMDAWYLIGNALTEGVDTLEAEVTAPGGTEYVDAWIAGGAGVRLRKEGGDFVLEADVGDLESGDYEVLFAADGADTAFAKIAFHRTHPLYVLASTDWDFSDPSDLTLAFQDGMHAQHPHVKITNFIGPYTFTDPAVSDAREAQLVAWMKKERDEFGGEIGLHIHPYCNFVEYAGVTCNTEESLAYPDDATGYTVANYAYTEEEFGDLLDAADELFMARGLGKPVTYRAGAWSASIDTLRALSSHGYVADTSAVHWATLEEWDDNSSATLYEWNMTNWSTIGPASQPYHPNDGDPQSDAAPTLEILEVPDNGSMVDYVSFEEMSAIIDANWDGNALHAPTTFMYGYHPAAQTSGEDKTRFDALLDYTDTLLASRGDGPVVYELLKNMPVVFPR